VSTTIANATPGGIATATPLERPSIMQVEDRAHRNSPLNFQDARVPARDATAPPRPPGIRSPQMATMYNAGRLTREVFGFATYWELASGNLSDVQYDKVSTFAYFGLTVNGSGGFDSDSGMTGWNSSALTNVINNAHGAGDRVVLVAKQFDQGAICSIVGGPAGQTAINNIIGAVKARGLDGVNVDFEGSAGPCAGQSNVQTQFTGWIASLSTQLRAQVSGAQLTVDSYSGAASWNDGFFRIDTLAPYVDAFFIMAYDMGISNAGAQGLPPTLPNAPLAGPYTYYDTRSVDQYVSKVGGDGTKVILGVPYYGYKTSTTTSGFNAPYNSSAVNGCNVNCADVYSDIQWELNTCGAQQLQRNWDSASSSPWAVWWSPGSNDPCNGNHNSWRELYYDDADSLGAKYDLVNNRNIRGAGMWALGFDHGSTDLWQAISNKFILWPGWDSLGGACTSVTVASNSDGRLEVFVVNGGGGLWHKWQTSPAGNWSGWAALGGSISQPVAVGRNADGRLEAFVVNTSNSLWHIWQTSPGNSTWSAWDSLGGSISQPPAVSPNADGRLEVFAVNSGGGLWHLWQTAPNGLWSGWDPLGGSISQPPSVARNADGRLEAFVVNTGGGLWHTWQGAPGSNRWSAWASMGGAISQPPAVAANSDGRLEAFVINTGGGLWHVWQTSPNGIWSDWASLGGYITQPPAVGASRDGRLGAFVVNTGNSVWQQAQVSAGSSAWSGWSGLGGATTLPLAVGRAASGSLQVFAIASDGTLWAR
jgi:hypothetical protein